uniref:Uncharacterized protein n=1 Tax=Tetradesmus obliquus TaxID=3088 RepID=A0A383WC71_TETOB|eukprot:jgi/Sobl393_1/43/SZX74782.1
MWGIQPPAVLQDPCNADKQVIYVPHQPQQDAQGSASGALDAAAEQHLITSSGPCSNIPDQAYKAAVQAAKAAARVKAMADIVALDETCCAADKEEARQLADLACAAARQAARGATSIVKAYHKPTNCGVDLCSEEPPASSRAAAVIAYRKQAIDILQAATAVSSQQQPRTPEQPEVAKHRACEQAVQKHKQGSCLPPSLQRQYKDEEVMMALEWALLRQQFRDSVGLPGLIKLLQTEQQMGISRWRLLKTAVTKLPLLWDSKDSSSNEASELLEQLKKEAREEQPLARISSSLEQQLQQKDTVREGKQLLLECKVWSAMTAPSQQYLQLMRTARLWPPGLRQVGRAAADIYKKDREQKAAEERRQKQQLSQQQNAHPTAAAAGAFAASAGGAMRPASPAGSETTGHSSSRASTPEGDSSAVFEGSPGSTLRSDASGYTETSLGTYSCSSYNHSCTSKATDSAASQVSTVGSALAVMRRYVESRAASSASRAASSRRGSVLSLPPVAAPAVDPSAASSSNSFTARLPSPRATSRLGLASRTASASALAAQEEKAAAVTALLHQEQQQQQQQRQRPAGGGLFERLR